MKQERFFFFTLIFLCSMSASCLAMEEMVKLCHERQIEIDRQAQEIAQLKIRIAELEKQRSEAMLKELRDRKAFEAESNRYWPAP